MTRETRLENLLAECRKLLCEHVRALAGGTTMRKWIEKRQRMIERIDEEVEGKQ